MRTNNLKVKLKPSLAAYPSFANSIGISNLGVLLVVIILGAGGYLIAGIFPKYYNYWELQAQFESMAEKAQVHDDKHIRNYIEQQLKILDIPAEIKDVKIQRRAKTMLIELEWYDEFAIPFRDKEYVIKEFNFHARAEEQF